MPFNGSGVFNRLYSWAADAANGIPISSARTDAEDDGFATGLSNCITRDGQSPATNNIPLGSNKITGLANGTAVTDAANVSQVQNAVVQWGGTSGGTATAQTITLSPAPAAYVAGQTFRFIAGFAAGAGMTLNVNSLGAQTVKLAQAAIAAGDFASGDVLTVTYNGTDFELVGAGAPAFGVIAVSGESDVVADSVKDTLTLAAGNGMTITTTPASDTVTLATPTNIQEFSSSGTWTKPANATFVMVEVWAGGGGGGSGRRGATNSGRAGGSGGGGGAYAFRLLKASDLSATESVTIGAGGSGGNAITTNDTDGQTGTNGGNTSFGSLLTSYGGAGGTAGNASSASGAAGGGVLSAGSGLNPGAPIGAGSAVGQFGGGSGSSSSHRASGFGGSAGGSGNGGAAGSLGGCSYQGGPGGGGGGGVSNSNVAFEGAAGGSNTGLAGGGGAGGAATGAAGTAGTGRQGGGGGGGASAAAGGTGGAGGGFGAGGGGGGASSNGNNSGAGGPGADGYCRVYSW